MKIIREIPARDTFEVRWPVLRPGRPIESCSFEGDSLESTKHFGLFLEGQLRGVVSLYENNSSLFTTNNQFQLRGMAVLEPYQGKGYGRDLVRCCEEYIESKGGALIWFNARLVAVAFYEKMGYQTQGDVFDIADVGPHFVMFKTINS